VERTGFLADNSRYVTSSLGRTIDQPRWVGSSLKMFGRVFGGATAYPKAKGIWRDDERGGALVKDEPVAVHCYTTPVDIQDERNLAVA
jgi:hypothetical protein